MTEKSDQKTKKHFRKIDSVTTGNTSSFSTLLGVNFPIDNVQIW